MSNAIDMSTPVTRRELQVELRKLATKDELKEAVKKLATKADLKEAVKKLATKADLARHASETNAKLEEIAKEAKANLEIWGGALVERIAESERTLMMSLAGHAGAHQEELRKQVSVFDEKYQDLPDRVKRLEAATFPDDRR